MSIQIRLGLFLMMMLQFAIWGAWLPKLYGYLTAPPAVTANADGTSISAAGESDGGGTSVEPASTEKKPVGLGLASWQVTLVFSAFNVAAILAMFFGNQFADRYFAAEKVLAVSHLIGGLAILGCAYVTDFWSFFALMCVHCLFYVPTISITNAIAFNAMRNAQQEFGFIRMGGTIGWIAVAWPFALFPSLLDVGTQVIFMVSGVLSLVLAIFSLTLPNTPPRKAAADESQAWLKAFRLLGMPFMLVLWIVTFIDASIHQSFFLWTESFLQSDLVGISPTWTMVVMSLGQVFEILTMLILGMVLAKLGWKITLIIGVLGHALRFSVFSFFPDQLWLIIAIQAIHGICYAFFFATVYIFVEEYFPKDIRSSAQGLFNLQILGLGPLAAAFLCPWLAGRFTMVDSTGREMANYPLLFLFLVAASVLGALILAVAFWPPAKKAEPEHPISEGEKAVVA